MAHTIEYYKMIHVKKKKNALYNDLEWITRYIKRKNQGAE